MSIIAAGLRGGRGDPGPPFRVDAQGTLAERAAYNNELANFTYLATDNGYLYFKGSLPGQWSEGMLFQGPPGPIGASFILRGQLDSTANLPLTGEIGHAWLIDGHAWVWGGTSWTDAGQIQGEKGESGRDGADGRGVSSVAVNASRHLIITYTDGSSMDAGLVPTVDGADGADGADGRGIAEALVNGSGRLILTFTDGATADAGLVRGADGADGRDGTNGANGRGVTSVAIDDSKHLIVTLTDGSQQDAGQLPSSDEVAALQQTVAELLERIETLESYHAVPENALAGPGGVPLVNESGDYLTIGAAA